MRNVQWCRTVIRSVLNVIASLRPTTREPAARNAACPVRDEANGIGPAGSTPGGRLQLKRGWESVSVVRTRRP